jgi:hypothetical protein
MARADIPEDGQVGGSPVQSLRAKGNRIMVELEIQDALWHEFVAIARRHRTPPSELAERVLREYVQRVSDEALLARSEQAARRARFRIEDTEEVVRQHRRRTR